MALHSFRLKLCSVKNIVQCRGEDLRFSFLSCAVGVNVLSLSGESAFLPSIDLTLQGELGIRRTAAWPRATPLSWDVYCLHTLQSTLFTVYSLQSSLSTFPSVQSAVEGL